MNMFKPTKATSVKEYFSLLPKERKEVVTFLHAFIQKSHSSGRKAPGTCGCGGTSVENMM
jgi:hypothetical protein